MAGEFGGDGRKPLPLRWRQGNTGVLGRLHGTGEDALLRCIEVVAFGELGQGVIARATLPDRQIEAHHFRLHGLIDVAQLIVVTDAVQVPNQPPPL